MKMTFMVQKMGKRANVSIFFIKLTFSCFFLMQSTNKVNPYIQLINIYN